MRNKLIFVLIILLGVAILPLYSQFGDLLDKIEETITETKEVEDVLSEEEIINGLKEALEIGTSNSVEFVSKVDGYFENPEIKIPLPKSVKDKEQILTTAGFDKQIKDFKLSMNRAAEKAAPQAKKIFVDAIKEMNFSDAKKILNGRENEATLYFQEKTSVHLQEVFKPIIHEAMEEIGVTQLYQILTDLIEKIPFQTIETCDLDQYVTDLALEGLFFMVAEEEKKIRKDPLAQVTDLLKKVFGG